LSPADRVVVDWRISENELVDDNEAINVDKEHSHLSQQTSCYIDTFQDHCSSVV